MHALTRILALTLIVGSAGCGGMEAGHDHSADETTDTPVHFDTAALGNNGLISISYALDSKLPVRGLNVATAVVTLADGSALVEPQVHAHLYMPAHGHDSPVSPTVTPLGDGKYRVENIVCSMAGEWYLTVHAKKDALDDQATFVLDVP